MDSSDLPWFFYGVYKTCFFVERKESESSRALHSRAIRVINTEKPEKSHGVDIPTVRRRGFVRRISRSVGKRRI